MFRFSAACVSLCLTGCSLLLDFTSADAGVELKSANDAGADAGRDAGTDAGPGPCLKPAPWALLPSADGGLSPTDVTTLTGDLNVLLGSWNSTSVESANAIVQKPHYDAAAWERFFTDYFVTANRAFTNGLRDYLVYPTFYWFDERTHLALQQGLSRALWRKLEQVTASGPALPSLLANASHQQTLFNIHIFFSVLGQFGTLLEPTRELWFSNYLEQLGENPEWLSGTAVLDAGTQARLPAYRAQVWVTLSDLRPRAECAKALVSQALSLSGERAALWSSRQILVHDNGTLSESTVRPLRTLVEGMSPHTLRLGHVVQNEALGISDSNAQSLTGKLIVPIPKDALGTTGYNPFPPEVPAWTLDGVWTAFIWNEHFHIDREVVEGSAELKARKAALLARAGLVDNQYLRSEVTGATFQKTPALWLSSTAYQFVGHTQRTLDLALHRFDAGFREPLNQFLFFAELYAADAGTLPFFQVASDGGVSVKQVPVSRDSRGRITRINLSGETLRVTLDDAGFATAWQ